MTKNIVIYDVGDINEVFKNLNMILVAGSTQVAAMAKVFEILKNIRTETREVEEVKPEASEINGQETL